MSAALAELKRYSSRIKPWIAVALLLAVAIVGYYSFLGLRYFNASGEVNSLNSEIGQLTSSLRRLSLDAEALQHDIETQEQPSETVRSLFSYLESYDLVGILSATAQESAVTLGRVDVGDGNLETQGEVQYLTQPMTAVLQGNISDIYRFLPLLQQKVPGTRVVRISISGFEGSSSAQVEILFYLLPEEEEEQ
ncbi:MAG: hypothetical protein ACE5KI_06705 [Dehalococcoidia bacterium]